MSIEPPDDIIDDLNEDLHRFETPDEALQYVRDAGRLPDAEMDLGETAIALALVFLPGVRPERFHNHLKKLANHVADEFAVRRKQAEDTLALRVAVLKKIIHEAHGYKGDTETYDDIQNANIIRVIDRRKGLPIALGIIYIVLARSQGWNIEGLNFPGHFLVRMEKDGERIILDPFREEEMNAAELRQLLKSIAGKGAELSHNFYDPVGNRDILVRLQNNLKKRLIEGEDYAQAIVVIEAMEALAPDEYRTLFDKAVLYAKLGQNPQAITAFEQYIARTPSPSEKHQARMLLQQISHNPE